MPLASKAHTAGNTVDWTICYGRWLGDAAEISNATVVSSSPTCPVTGVTVLGDDVVFFLSGVEVGDQLTLTLTMSDTRGRTKLDSIQFTVVPP